MLKRDLWDIVYVTHDQKEDWWEYRAKVRLLVQGIELRLEFTSETGQEFHMYSMNSFINTYNKMNEVPIDKSAIAEVIGLENADKKRESREEKVRIIFVERIAPSGRNALKKFRTEYHGVKKLSLILKTNIRDKELNFQKIFNINMIILKQKLSRVRKVLI